MSDLKIGQQYEVDVSRGLNLRSEPTTKSQVILAMPNGSIVTLHSDEVHTSDDHEWLNIQYISNGQAEIGWAASEYLKIVEDSIYHFDGDSLGNIMFKFDDPNTIYVISKANLKKYDGTYFFKGSIPGGQEITDPPTGKPIVARKYEKPYWTTQRNIDTLKAQKVVFVADF